MAAQRAGARVLPEVVAAVGKDMDELMDGGIRRGADIVKAMALRAKRRDDRAWLCLWHGGGEGQAGIERALEIFRADHWFGPWKLLGCKSVAELDASYIQKRG